MSRFKKANVIFADDKYNYSTSVNGKLTNTEIIEYFKDSMFNLGTSLIDDMQKCIDCTVEPSNL